MPWYQLWEVSLVAVLLPVAYGCLAGHEGEPRGIRVENFDSALL